MTNLGYIDETGLTSKGRFATYINGYEIQLTELFFNGFFEGQDEIQLFIVLVSMVYENKSDRLIRIPKFFQKLAKSVFKAIEPAKVLEAMLGIKSEIKDPDFGLAGAAQSWACGRPFQELAKYTTSSPGDIIRTFRQSIQICRQLRKACQGYGSFITLLDRCMENVNRDEVNALMQLQAFAEI